MTAELIPQIVAAVEARRQQGQSLRQLALQLGIPTSSLAAWCLGAEPAPPDVSADSAAPSLQAPMQAQTPGLRTVEVSANQPPAKADPQRPVKRSLTVRSPSGFTVHGLTLQQALVLMRRLS